MKVFFQLKCHRNTVARRCKTQLPEGVGADYCLYHIPVMYIDLSLCLIKISLFKFDLCSLCKKKVVLKKKEKSLAKFKQIIYTCCLRIHLLAIIFAHFCNF